MKILLFAKQLQELLLPIVKYILIFLVILLVLLLAIYLAVIFVHLRQKRYLAMKTPKWQNTVKALLSGDTSIKDLHTSRRGRKYLKEILIQEFLTGNSSIRNRIIEIYKQLGLYDDDIRTLNSRAWWKKVQSVERLGDLEMGDAEDKIFYLLTDRRDEVRFSALKMLASIHSQRLFKALPKVFKESRWWSYRYLINKLFLADVPAANLKPLAISENRGFRKAAAILMGRKGNEEAIPLMRSLINDKIKDVRREAVRALGRIGLTETIPLLSEKAADGDPQVRAAVADALGEVKNNNTLPILEKLADDPDFDVRFRAFHALNKFGIKGRGVISKYKDKRPEIALEFLAAG